MKVLRALGVVGLAGGAGYVLVSTGRLTLDVGLGRRTRPLGPIHRSIAAPPETVFQIIAAPYLGKTPRAMADKVRVLERGTDMVLAEHFTPIGYGLRASTVETVRFERPGRITFQLVRGPVPYVHETFELVPAGSDTAFTYSGEIGADFWAAGQWWAKLVAERWVSAVEQSLADIVEEAERRPVPSTK